MKKPAEKIVYGLFDSAEALQAAFERLMLAQIPVEQITLMMNEDVRDRDFRELERTRAGEGAALGGVIGGALGGILGGLAVLGSSMTGIGLLVVGPLFALAATGGFVGGLIGHGVPAEEARRLHEALAAGKTIIAVHPKDAEERRRSERLLSHTHGEKLDLGTAHEGNWTGV